MMVMGSGGLSELGESQFEMMPTSSGIGLWQCIKMEGMV